MKAQYETIMFRDKMSFPSILQWEFQDPKMYVLYSVKPYFGCVSPYIGLIYGRYLQFRFLKWPLNTHFLMPFKPKTNDFHEHGRNKPLFSPGHLTSSDSEHLGQWISFAWALPGKVQVCGWISLRCSPCCVFCCSPWVAMVAAMATVSDAAPFHRGGRSPAPS